MASLATLLSLAPSSGFLPEILAAVRIFAQHRPNPECQQGVYRTIKIHDLVIPTRAVVAVSGCGKNPYSGIHLQT
jgi:hypothetical protein